MAVYNGPVPHGHRLPAAHLRQNQDDRLQRAAQV